MDRAGLADFLRIRRERLQPEDVGLPRSPRRRTPGLRREEVSALAQMSTDYYSRLERETGPQPSEQMLAAIARALHLSLAERDHLFLLAGHAAPRHVQRADHINVGLMRVLDRLHDTPAQVMNSVGATLLQTPPAVALVGDETRFTGHARSAVYRWYTDPASRRLYPEQDHEHHGRAYTAQLRATATREGPQSRAAALAQVLLARSPEFAADWSRHEIGLGLLTDERKRILHPQLGLLELHCQVLLDPDQAQALLIFTAADTGSQEKLRLLPAVTLIPQRGRFWRPGIAAASGQPASVAAR
jgi:transcriptional regulator with XRE-family HTH domain